MNEAKLHFDISSVREDALMFAVTVPGERWEVELFSDGTVVAEVFRSNAEMGGPELLDQLFAHAD